MKYGEITHSSHPQHKLRFEYAEVPFKCDGCKEVGIGSRFKCGICDYDLHRQCAQPSVAPLRHPFYPKCAFQFLARPPGDGPRFCNACERDVAGFVLHCYSCGFDLHPCCAALPTVIEAAASGGSGSSGGVRLYLYKKASSECHRCGRKGRSWSYRSSCKKYNLHVACVMEILVESWHEIYYGGGGGAKRVVMGMGGGGYGRIPSIKGWEKSHHRGKGKVKRCCEVAALAVQFIISAVLGDPTAIIAGIVGSFFSR